MLTRHTEAWTGIVYYINWFVLGWTQEWKEALFKYINKITRITYITRNLLENISSTST